MFSAKNVLFLDNLLFHVYTIGYKNQGECIVFIVETDYGNSYSGMIDCYEKDGLNVAEDILQSHSVNCLDFVCWTHPHLDHSIGYDSVFNTRIDENTQIVYPINLKSIDYSKVSDGTVPTIQNIKDLITSTKRKKSKLKPVSNVAMLENIKFGNGGIDTNSNFLFQIHSFAPVSDIVEKRDLVDGNLNINDYSIALMITFGDKSFVFGGDIQDSTIKKIEFYPEKIDYLKIPHHGSEHSLKILDWIEDNGVEIACTTEYKPSKIPTENTLRKYSNHVKCLYSTHTGNEDFGYLYTVYDAKKDTFFNFTEGRMKNLTIS